VAISFSVTPRRNDFTRVTKIVPICDTAATKRIYKRSPGPLESRRIAWMGPLVASGAPVPTKLSRLLLCLAMLAPAAGMAKTKSHKSGSHRAKTTQAKRAKTTKPASKAMADAKPTRVVEPLSEPSSASAEAETAPGPAQDAPRKPLVAKASATPAAEP
jgi:hypothetical protein